MFFRLLLFAGRVDINHARRDLNGNYESCQREEKAQLMTYRIYLEGKLGSARASWFSGMSLTTHEGVTVLQGDVPDQPALHGLLKRIRDLGLTIVKVERLESSHGEAG